MTSFVMMHITSEPSIGSEGVGRKIEYASIDFDQTIEVSEPHNVCDMHYENRTSKS